LTDDPLTPESPGMLAHQKAFEGDLKLTRGLIPHLPVPSTMEEWHWAMALNQARAIRTAVEYFRSLAPQCTGGVVWQLNDCWPVVSWSAVDGDGRRKPMFYALRHAHADRLVTVQPDAPGPDALAIRPGLLVAVVNDTPTGWTGTLSVSRRSYDGAVLAKEEVMVDVSARDSIRVPVPNPVATPDDPGSEVVVAELGERRGVWFFAEDRHAALPPPRFTATVSPVADGCEVTVTAQTLLRDLALLVDKVHPDAVVDDMLATLLPGETVTWRVRCPSNVDSQRLLAPDVLCSANQLVAPRRP
jgi:beta-mannosidase